MTNQRFLFALALSLTAGLSSCELAGDIFEAGAWFGVIVVVLIVAVVVWLIRKIF